MGIYKKNSKYGGEGDRVTMGFTILKVRKAIHVKQ